MGLALVPPTAGIEVYEYGSGILAMLPVAWQAIGRFSLGMNSDLR